MESIGLVLKNGEIVIIDLEDFERVNQYRWYKSKDTKLRPGYPGLRISRNNFIPLHRFIMGAKKGQKIDHINGNILDCRKENLRFCTLEQNAFNRQKHKEGYSKYKGVTWKWWKSGRSGTWLAHIQYKRKKIHIGYFKVEIEAARAYDKKAKELFGEFARLNFPE